MLEEVRWPTLQTWTRLESTPAQPYWNKVTTVKVGVEYMTNPARTPTPSTAIIPPWGKIAFPWTNLQQSQQLSIWLIQ